MKVLTCPRCQSALHPTTGDCPRGCQKHRAAPGSHICPHCHTSTSPRTRVPGSLAVELLLWLFFLLPGLLYTGWRLMKKDRTVCPDCDQSGMIPVDTPRGHQLLKQSRE